MGSCPERRPALDARLLGLGGSVCLAPGYWGPHVGFYGGVNYGFGYFGVGYGGGYWRGRTFFYNRSVTNIHITNVHIYNQTVIHNNVNRVSYDRRRWRNQYATAPGRRAGVSRPPFRGHEHAVAT